MTWTITTTKMGPFTQFGTWWNATASKTVGDFYTCICANGDTEQEATSKLMKELDRL